MIDFIVVEGAKISCEYGVTDSTFLEAPYDGCTIDGKNPILEHNLNIGSFVFCTLRNQACTFKSLDLKWRHPASCGSADGSYVTTKSLLFCKERGMLSIIDAGQDCVGEEDGVLKCVDFD
jgi:hypothetical protein